MFHIKPIIFSFLTISVLQAGVLDGILSGDYKKPDLSGALGSVKGALGSNIMQGAAGLVPQEIMGLCYNYKPTKKTGSSSGICSALKGGIDPCAKAPNLSLYGYTKKASDPLFKKQIEGMRTYCEKIAGDTAKKVSVPEAIKGYSGSSNVKSGEIKNEATIYGSKGLLGWDNIKAYSANGKEFTNNYYLHQAVSKNDYLSFQYYKDILENSVGTGSGVRSKVNIFSPKELRDATVSYNSIKDYDDDVKKIAGVLKTSTGQASSVRISTVSETEMAKAELSAMSSGIDADMEKEKIGSLKIDEINKAVDSDVDYKTKFYGDLTANPNNRIVYPAKGYVDTLPPEKKVIAVKKIELQAKKDAMLRASFEEIGEMRKELASLVMENSKISARQFNASAAQSEIDRLIK